MPGATAATTPSTMSWAPCAMAAAPSISIPREYDDALRPSRRAAAGRSLPGYLLRGQAACRRCTGPRLRRSVH
ncbi:hypothetical protein G6F59_017593 [Rhizopus arrhizus]|nr:hypothetical protein G6F32_016803 [Rhizopus arrhizus]KAG1385131.1 hypothetical protein G6F59_017593 [Rhizopus arrhizus]